MSFLGRWFGSSQAPKSDEEIPKSSPPLRIVEENDGQNFKEDAQVSIEPPKADKKGKRKTKAQKELDNLELGDKSTSDQNGDDLQKNSGPVIEEGERNEQTESSKPKAKRERKSKKNVDVANTVNDEPPNKAAHTKVKKPRRPKSKSTALEESPPKEPESLDAVAEVQAPHKAVKRRQKKPKVVLSEDIVHSDDDEENPPLGGGPAHTGQQIQVEVSNTSHESEIAEQSATPVRPSAKALGKRKASDTLPEVLSNPKRLRKSKESPGTSLLDHGFSRERSGSHANVEDLVQTAQELYIRSTMEGVELEPVLPLEKKGKRKLKAKAPIMLSGGGSVRSTSATAQRATPQFTPINKKSTNVPAQNIEGKNSRDLGNALKNLEDPFQISQTLSPMSTQKRKRRLPVESQEGEPSNFRSQGASKKSEAKKATPRKSKAPKEPKEKGPVRKGKITTEEAEAIDTAVETHRQLHELTQFRMNEIIQNAQGFVEHKDFWTSVREAAPEVPHRKIYETCRRKYHNFEARASWTKEQDDELRDAYKKFPQKWKQIGELINRFPEDVRDRWRNYLVCGDKQRKDYWDKAEEDRLREVVAECVATIRESKRVSNDPQVDQESDEKLIDWGMVSERMGFVRSRLQCIGKWKQLKERENSEDERLEAITKTEWRAEEATRAVQEMTGSEILQLLYAIRESGAGKESKIPWLVVTEAMNKLGKRMSLKLCFRKLRNKIPNGKEMRFRDALEHLISTFEKSQPNIPARYKDREFVRDVKRRPNRYSIVNSSMRVNENSGDEGQGKDKRRYNERDVASSSKAKRKRDPKSTNSEPAEEPEEVVDNGDGPSKKKKSKAKRTVGAPVGEDPPESEPEGGPTSPKNKKPPKSKSGHAATAEEDSEQMQTPKQGRKKKKLRDSMKRRDESQSQSQERTDGFDSVPVVDDVAQTLQSLKKGRKLRKNKARELDDVLREELASRGEPSSQHGENLIEEGQHASQFSNQEQNPEPSSHLNETGEDDEVTELSERQDTEVNGDKSPMEAYLSDESGDHGTEMIHPIEGQPGDDDEDAEQEQNAQVRDGDDEMEIDPDEGEVYGIPNGLSPHSFSDEEQIITPQRAESVDLDTLTPVKKSPARPADDNSTSTSGSSSSDSDSASDLDSGASHRQVQEVDGLDQEIGQFGEEQEIESQQELEEEPEGPPRQDQDEELRGNGHLQEDGDISEPSSPRSVSPDLDTPVEDDGRNGRRSFRSRPGRINYDDAAHLVVSEEESDSSSEEPRPKANGRRARKVNGTNLKVNGVERHGSVSSSDDSIPAEATPQHVRAERGSQNSPPQFREHSEDIDWAAVRRRRVSKGRGTLTAVDTDTS